MLLPLLFVLSLPHASHYFTFGIVIMNTPLALTRKFTPTTPRNPPSPYPSPSIAIPAFLFEPPISPHQTKAPRWIVFYNNLRLCRYAFLSLIFWTWFLSLLKFDAPYLALFFWLLVFCVAHGTF